MARPAAGRAKDCLNPYFPLFFVAMRNLTFYLILSTVLLFPMSVFGQTSAFSCQGAKPLSEAGGLAAIDKVQNKYLKVQTLKARFLQFSYLAALNISERAEGEVWFAKPGKMRWNYSQPEEQVFLVRDDNIWFYQAEDQQVTIDRFDRVLITDLPVAFLMGLGDLRKDFVFVKGCHNQTGILLQLGAGSGKKQEGRLGDELQAFTLLIDPVTFFPIGADVLHAGGNKTTILLSEEVFDPEVDPEIFKADFPRGIDVNDRRSSR